MTQEEERESSKRPVDSDFKQQRLPAWQPLLTPKWVIGTFLLVGCVFIPIGIVIVVASDRVVEYSVRYDNNPSCPTNGTTCRLEFTIDDDMTSPVYVYYELTNYYQNHRRYVKSRSDPQLRGDSGSTGTCTPLERNDNSGKILYPCGLVANSMFNDSFTNAQLESPVGSVPVSVALQNQGIAWQSDIDHKFKFSSELAAEGTNVSTDGHVLPDVASEEFMVWMRTAGLPTFRKLHRKIERDIPAGSILTIDATNIYDVASFSGEKRLVLSTTSWLGGKNRFLGWSYIAVAIVCLLLGLAFHIKNQVSPRRLGDMQYFTWAGAGERAAGDTDQ